MNNSPSVPPPKAAINDTSLCGGMEHGHAVRDAVQVGPAEPGSTDWWPAWAGRDTRIPL